MKHLHEINGRYAAVVAVPLELRGLIGKPALSRWLGRDREEAERCALAFITQFHNQIATAKTELDASCSEIAWAAKAHYAEELRGDDCARQASGTAAVASLNRWSAPRRCSLLRQMSAHQLPLVEMEALMGYGVDQAISSGSVDPKVDRRALLMALASAQLAAMAVFEERDRSCSNTE